ncbi:hypothetical protein CPT_Machias_129 [Staphylococcus phage Machias]|nr:hypothetical protein CPT_Machias_129 [Staphylococcus phage Machias]WPH64335.1 hypothetical protein [Staphylococcus phage vB_StaM_PB50]
MLKRLYELLTRKRFEKKLYEFKFSYQDHEHLNEVHEFSKNN